MDSPHKMVKNLCACLFESIYRILQIAFCVPPAQVHLVPDDLHGGREDGPLEGAVHLPRAGLGVGEVREDALPLGGAVPVEDDRVDGRDGGGAELRVAHSER